MQRINDSLVEDDVDIERPKRVEEPPKSCSIPVPSSFKKQIGLFHNGELSYKTVASTVVFLLALNILIIFGGYLWTQVDKVVSINGFTQLFSIEQLSKLFLTEAQDTPLPLIIEIRN